MSALGRKVENFPQLGAAVFAALTPRSPRERARSWLIGGWTARQVLERLPAPVVEAWMQAGEGDPIVRQRRLATAVHTLLVTMAAAGRVRRRSSRYGVELKSKGLRHAVVDVFRQA